MSLTICFHTTMNSSDTPASLTICFHTAMDSSDAFASVDSSAKTIV